jgi:hypothetical protein
MAENLEKYEIATTDVQYIIPGMADEFETKGFKGLKLEPDDMFFWCLMNSFILIFTSLKLMSFVRIHEEFGRLTTLVG